MLVGVLSDSDDYRSWRFNVLNAASWLEWSILTPLAHTSPGAVERLKADNPELVLDRLIADAHLAHHRDRAFLHLWPQRLRDIDTAGRRALLSLVFVRAACDGEHHEADDRPRHARPRRA